jgi:hypothetical protein
MGVVRFTPISGRRVARWALVCGALALLGGCSRLGSPLDPMASTDPSQGAGEPAIYPHSEGFKLTSAHGERYYREPKACKACHGQDLLGGNTHSTCTKCHPGFPHTAEFKTSFVHGSVHLKTGTCGACHGKDYSGGRIRLACSRCHEYPHVEGWKKPEAHGQKYLALAALGDPGVLPERCMRCHVEGAFKKRNPGAFKGCDECHLLMPHTDAIKQGDHQELARAYTPERCAKCHTGYMRFVPNFPDAGCRTCHDLK